MINLLLHINSLDFHKSLNEIIRIDTIIAVILALLMRRQTHFCESSKAKSYIDNVKKQQF